MSATKKDIVKLFSDKMDIHPSTSLKIVDQLFDSIIEILSSSQRIEIRNFGVFETKKTLPRRARNPKTGETVFTLGSYKVKFKAGKEMLSKISNSSDVKNVSSL